MLVVDGWEGAVRGSGIGIDRIGACIIEQSHDKDGIIWPAAVAPYQVLITLLGETASEAGHQEAVT